MFSFRQELDLLENLGLRRSMRVLETPTAANCVIDGKRVLNLCSNNYLGLANDSRIAQAAISAMKKHGFGSGASRLVSGTTIFHKKLEADIAEFKNAEKCLVFNSGYTANLGIISPLVGRGDSVFCDRSNHASIIDGIILSRAELKRYPHCDCDALEAMLKKTTGARKRLIVTDSVFSMGGDIAPLERLFELAEQYECRLMIDDAHATGVLGKKGRGALEFLGLEHKKDYCIQMGTMSKAAGGFGAYVCGSADFIEYLINTSRAFVYTTSLPPAIAAANSKAIEIIQKEPERRQRLHENAGVLREGLRRIGFQVPDSKTPIIPVAIGQAQQTMDFSRQLFDKGIFVQGIRPPTVPEGKSQLRITVMATHSKKEIERAIDAFKIVAKQICLT